MLKSQNINKNNNDNNEIKKINFLKMFKNTLFIKLLNKINK